jgi:hypothetical protein
MLPVVSLWKRQRGAEGMRLGSNRRLSSRGIEKLKAIPSFFYKGNENQRLR